MADKKPGDLDSLSDDLSRSITPEVKRALGHEPDELQAQCKSQNCGGEGYSCSGSGNHKCEVTFSCSGVKYSGFTGEPCGDFSCVNKYY